MSYFNTPDPDRGDLNFKQIHQSRNCGIRVKTRHYFILITYCHASKD